MTKELKEAIEFMIHNTNILLRPDVPVPKGFCPTFYCTLSYEGDVKLLEDYKKYEKLLLEYINND